MTNARNHENKVASLPKREPASPSKNNAKLKQIHFRRRRMAVLLLVAFCVFSFAGFHLFQDYRELAALQKEQAESAETLESLQSYKTDLKDEVRLLHDTRYVEKLARSRYMLSKDGEQIYKIPALQDEENNRLPATKNK